MASVLVVFESKYGQTSKIAEHIGQLARARSHFARVVHVEDASRVDVAEYGGIVVLAPVYYSMHSRNIHAFVRANAHLFGPRATAFFSVSNSAASRDPVARENARRLADATPASLGWSPTLVATAGGALAYPRYNYFVRLAARWLARAEGAPTDVRRVHERTNWPQVDRDTASFLEPLERADRGTATTAAVVDPSSSPALELARA